MTSDPSIHAIPCTHACMKVIPCTCLYLYTTNVDLQHSSELAVMSAKEKIGMLKDSLCGSEKERDAAKQNMERTSAFLSSQIQQLKSKLQKLEAESVSSSSNTSNVTNEVS